jgi:hypothetical protein
MKQGSNDVEFPLYGTQHWQGFNPKQAEKGMREMTWIGDQVKLERRQGSLSRVFIYMGTESESETET